MDRIRTCGGGSLRVATVDPDLYNQCPTRTLQEFPFAHKPTIKKVESANAETKQCLIVARRVEDASILDSYHSLRAESTLSNHSDSQISATCPPFLNEWHQQDDEHIEMRKFPNQHITIGNASSALNMV
jgi:hypothetical protein